MIAFLNSPAGSWVLFIALLLLAALLVDGLRRFAKFSRARGWRPGVADGADAIAGAVEAVYGRYAIAGPPVSGHAAYLGLVGAVKAEAIARSDSLRTMDPAMLAQRVESAIGRAAIADPNASITQTTAVATEAADGKATAVTTGGPATAAAVATAEAASSPAQAPPPLSEIAAIPPAPTTQEVAARAAAERVASAQPDAAIVSPETVSAVAALIERVRKLGPAQPISSVAAPANPLAAQAIGIDLFQAALAFTLSQEGGWADNPADPGGATMHGITLATFRSWRHDPEATAADLRAITDAEVEALYGALYWNPVHGAALPPGIGLSLFDAAVSLGVRRAVLLFQGVLKVTPDGVVGPVTLGAAHQAMPDALLADFAATRETFYRQCANWPDFHNGWLARTAACLAAARRSAAGQGPVAPVPPPVVEEPQPAADALMASEEDALHPAASPVIVSEPIHVS